MKLSEILKDEECAVFGDDIGVSGLSHNATKAQKGDMFFCIKGTQVDGHNFAKTAVKNGASVVVCEHFIEGLNATQVVVKDSRSAMSKYSSAFYGEPQNGLKIVMVTGTNGKTTTTYMLKSILESAGEKVAVIGTNGTEVGDEKIDSALTTPDPIELFGLLKRVKKMGATTVCMEASAHALALNKLCGLTAEVAVLTNITHDHLDFFKNMENYASAKSKLFTRGMAKVGVFNIDDARAEKLFLKNEIPSISVGIDTPADINAQNIEQTKNGQKFNANIAGKIHKFNLGAKGRFNVSNALGAIATAKLLGLSENQIAKGLENFRPVTGRFNMFNKNGINIIIDYAHTPEGVGNALKAIEQMADGKRIITVFGCGGNRDAGKRPLMGRVASEHSNFVIVTTDNPRYEDPKNIASDIARGFNGKRNFQMIEDRREAIKQALSMAREGDFVAVLGKGHENYMDIRGEKIAYSDIEEIEKF